MLAAANNLYSATLGRIFSGDSDRNLDSTDVTRLITYLVALKQSDEFHLNTKAFFHAAIAQLEELAGAPNSETYRQIFCGLVVVAMAVEEQYQRPNHVYGPRYERSYEDLCGDALVDISQHQFGKAQHGAIDQALRRLLILDTGLRLFLKDTDARKLPFVHLNVFNRYFDGIIQSISDVAFKDNADLVNFYKTNIDPASSLTV